MNECPHCHHQNRPGELLCANCHQPLTAELTSRTRTLQVETSGKATQEGVRPDRQTIESDNAVLLYVSGEKTPVRLEAWGQTILGRIHQENPRRPDVDLNAFRAYEKGVSCIHAAIHREASGIAIEDLGSTNGTYLNSERLAPHQRQDLNNGDEIRLGNLFVRVYFSGSQA